MDTKRIAQALRLLADAIEGAPAETKQPQTEAPIEIKQPIPAPEVDSLRKQAAQLAAAGHRAAIIAHLAGKRVEQLDDAGRLAFEAFLRGLQ